MSFDTVPASTFPLSIQTGTELAPVWTEVGGINSITVTPSRRDADTTTFANAGWDQATVVGRGSTVAASGFAIYDAAGVKDPGQVACEALADEIGSAARGTFRVSLPGGKAFEFTGDVNVTPFGGGVSDVARWEMEIRVATPPSIVTVAVPPAPPAG